MASATDNSRALLRYEWNSEDEIPPSKGRPLESSKPTAPLQENLYYGNLSEGIIEFCHEIVSADT